MSFEYEHQMLKPAENWLQSQGFCIKREFRLPWGVCDLVGCSFNEENSRKRLSLGQYKPIGPQSRIAIYSKLPDQDKDKAITFEELQDRLFNFFDKEKVTFEVERLIKDKFVRETPEGKLQRVQYPSALSLKRVRSIDHAVF